MENKKRKNNNYQVNKSKLKKEFKNWRYLCDSMEWHFSYSLNVRKSQEKSLSTVCKWHKEGNKVVIDVIYEDIKQREIKYSPAVTLRKAVEKQVVRELYEYHCKTNDDIKWIYDNMKPQQGMIISKADLMQRVGLANSNTNVTYGNQGIVSSLLRLDYDMFLDVFDHNRENAKNTLESALKCLKNIISTREVFELIIEETDENSFDGTTRETVTKKRHLISDNAQYDFIKLTGYNKILQKYDIPNLKELYTNFPHMIQKFFNDVNEWVCLNCCEEEYIIKYGETIKDLKGLTIHFQKLKLTFDNEFIEKRYLKDGILTTEEKELIESKSVDYYKFKMVERLLISDMNCKRNESNAKNRHNRAIKNTDESDFRYKTKARKSPMYLDVASVTNNIFHAGEPIKYITHEDVEKHKKELNDFGVNNIFMIRKFSVNDGINNLLSMINNKSDNSNYTVIESKNINEELSYDIDSLIDGLVF